MSIISKYEELLDKSFQELETLIKQVEELKTIKDDILKLKNHSTYLPQKFEESFKKIQEQAKKYSDSIGIATNTFLIGHNSLFTKILSEFEIKIKDIGNEISRLEKIDLEIMFEGLKDDFIQQARKDISEKFSRFDNIIAELKISRLSLESNTNELKDEITRLANIDLEKHFDKLQKTLSDIFGAINSLNVSFTTIIQTLNKIVQSNSDIETKIDKTAKDTKTDLDTLTKSFESQLQQQKDELIKNRDILESQIKSVEIKNEQISKDIKINRIIGIVGISIIVTIFIIQFFVK